VEEEGDGGGGKIFSHIQEMIENERVMSKEV